MFNKLDARRAGFSAGAVTGLLTALFALAHVFYYLLGARFDAAPLDWYWQYIDPGLLKQKLLVSVYYLHSQPPLFNLFLGAVLKVFPGHHAAAFQVIYLVFGWALFVTLFWLQVRLGVGRAVALLASTFFAASPAFFLYEHWLFYTFPVAALLTAAAFFFHRVVAGGRAWAAGALFAVLFVVCGTRHIFGFVYYAAVVAAVVAFVPRRVRRKVLLLAAAPGILLLSFYVKNYALFGQYHLSSWGGMYLWQVTGENLKPEEEETLSAEGEMSPAFPRLAFSDLSAYPQSYRRLSRYKNVPVLMRPRKSYGASNLNHLAYVAISRDYLHDALHVVRRYPRAYLRGVARSWFVYFKCCSGDMGGYTLFENALENKKVAAVNELWGRVFYGKVSPGPLWVKWRGASPHPAWDTAHPFLLAALPLLLFYGVRAAWKRDAAAAAGLDRAGRLTVAFICFHILYVCVIANTCAYAENNRMRFMTDPFYVVLAALFVRQYLVGRPAGRPYPS